MESAHRPRAWVPSIRCLGTMVFFLCLGGFNVLYGQVPDKASDVKTWEKLRFSFDASSLYMPKAHVRGGGNVTFTSCTAGAETSVKVSGNTDIGLGFFHGSDDYNFTPLAGFAVADPWNKVHRVGVNGKMRYGFAPKWGLFAAPVVQYSAEEGADFGRSIIYGGALGATYTPNPRLAVGFGVGLLYRLEETVPFPALFMDWRINDRLRLASPLSTGPVGSAGLELGYTMGSSWVIALGGGYRSSRFRLSQGGPVPGGVGQVNAVTGYLNLTRRLGKHLLVSVYGGAVFAGSVRIEDRTGERIDSTGFSAAPLMGLVLTASF